MTDGSIYGVAGSLHSLAEANLLNSDIPMPPYSSTGIISAAEDIGALQGGCHLMTLPSASGISHSPLETTWLPSPTNGEISEDMKDVRVLPNFNVSGASTTDHGNAAERPPINVSTTGTASNASTQLCGSSQETTVCNPESHVCTICDGDFRSKRHLRFVWLWSSCIFWLLIISREHQRSHNRPHECPESECLMSFSTPRDLQRHHQAKHRAVASKCPYCLKHFKGARRDNLKRHMRSFHKAVSATQIESKS